MSSLVTCPNCGSPSISPHGICEYCKKRVLLPFAAGRNGQSGAAQAASNPELEAENELRFLLRQFEETRHPSLPLKIEHARQKLEFYKGKRGEA